jgi:23S rRNA (pseudouridine1915-N3)-methyltransferase
VRLSIVAVNARQPPWADAAVEEFLGRLPADWRVAARTVKAEPRDGRPAPLVAQREAERLRAGMPPDGVLVALDPAGQDWTSARFAQALRAWRDDGAHPVFVIGGADGLDPQLKTDAHLLLRLSSLTLPHALARVVLAEQLYRGWSMLAGHPYHRG